MTFLELLVYRNIPFHRHSKPGEIWLCCPFCADVKFRLGLNWRKGLAHCFNCDWKSRKAIDRILREWRLDVRVSGEPEEEAEKKQAPIRLPDDFLLLHHIPTDDEAPFIDARRYMRKRGFPLSQLRRHRIGACFTGRLAFRIVCPVFADEKLVGLVARTWAGAEPKYLNSVGERSIWNLEKAHKGQRLILAEGIFKGMALERTLPEDCCGALLGHSITQGQLDQILKAGFRKVGLWPDPDPQGIEGVLDVGEKLAEAGVQVEIPSTPPILQADDYPPEMLAKVAAHWVPLDRWQAMRLRITARKR